MKKTAYALTLVLALLFSVRTQANTVTANPYWPWGGYYPIGHPEITVVSPVQNGSYLQNDVWLNFTVTKPSDWDDLEGQLKFVAYLVDGERMNLINDYKNEGEIRVEVQDPLGVVNSPSEFNFSIKLTGLWGGKHSVDVYAEGLVKDKGDDMPLGTVLSDTIHFTVTGKPYSFPTILVIAFVIILAHAGLGLLVYFKKRK